MKKFIGFFAVCLVALSALLLTSCGEKKLDVKKIKELVAVENPTSSQYDEMIDQLEIVVNTPIDEVNKLSEDDQMAVGDLMFKLWTSASPMDESDVELSDAQVKRVKELSEKMSENAKSLLE